jgi:hypothetical protein
VLAFGALQKERVAKDVAAAAQAGNISAVQLQQHNDAIAARDTLRTASFVTLGIGSALALTGLGLFLFDDPRPATQVAPTGRRVDGSLSLGPGSLVLSGRF